MQREETMKKKIVAGIAVAVFSLCLAVSSAFAGVKAGAVSLSPMGGGYDFDDDRNLLDLGKTFSLALGYNFTEYVSAELGVAYIHTDADWGPGDYDVYMYQPRVDLVYNIVPDGVIVPYLAAGVGYILFDEDVDDQSFGELDDSFQANAGLGVKFFVSDNIALRADARYFHGFEDSESEFEMTAGLIWQIGGVEPAAAPAARPEKDGDGDGVPDSEDECPDTPKGVRVDKKGCWKKSTPYTGMEKSGESGKSLSDSDADPVSISDEMISVVVYFNFDDTSIKQINYNSLEQLADFMTKYPELTAVVEGHTDSIGSTEYNERLSLKRAEAVRDFLVSRHGIDTSRFELKAMGESVPAQSNTTAEGRRLNRRAVTITVQP